MQETSQTFSPQSFWTPVDIPSRLGGSTTMDAFMVSAAKRLTLLPWVPMGFCAALAIITLVTMLSMMAVNGTDPGGGWAIAFLCNLPLCFMFVGFTTSHLQREIRELHEQIVELQNKRVS